jgi:hypothetical protein
MELNGASLMRASGAISERVERLKLVDDPIAPVDAAEPTQNALDEDTKGALVRFARFVNKEGRKKPAPKKATQSGLPKAYLDQIEMRDRENDRGATLDITI